MEDGRWIWKSKDIELETLVRLDDQPLQKIYECTKCGGQIHKGPFYRIHHKIPIRQGWLNEFKWVVDNTIWYVDVKHLRFFFHQNCYDYNWLKKQFEVWWIP